MKKVIFTKNAPAAIGPYSQAIAANGFLFVSGQIPIDPESGAMVGENAAQQAERALSNLGEILKEAGCSYADVVKTTVFLKDIGDFAAVNEVYARYFAADCPARSAFEVGNLPKGALVEIESIAVLPNA